MHMRCKTLRREIEIERPRNVSDIHVRINIFDLIDSICDDFRKRLKEGKRPRIVDFLLKDSGNAWVQFFCKLLPIDIRYRESSGENPQSSDYLGQFPQHKR